MSNESKEPSDGGVFTHIIGIVTKYVNDVNCSQPPTALDVFDVIGVALMHAGIRAHISFDDMIVRIDYLRRDVLIPALKEAAQGQNVERAAVGLPTTHDAKANEGKTTPKPHRGDPTLN
jgi:hypothetical protein